MKKSLICLIIILIPIISASDVLVWQGQYYTGTTFNVGTYEFNFTVYDTLTSGNICYSNTTSLTTGNFGEWKTEQFGVSSSCANVSKDYYLNINIGGVDQTPRRRLVVWNSLRKNVNEYTNGNLLFEGTLSGLSPLKLQDEINFIKSDGTITSALYNAPREYSSALPIAFADSLIHDIIQETNDYGMQECFWDENTETMQMCINGAYLSGRATTISRSMQIVGNTTSKPVNENFTLCERNEYVDCNSDTTGADLLVQDDIEAIGSIFSQENITASHFIGDGTLLTDICLANGTNCISTGGADGTGGWANTSSTTSTTLNVSITGNVTAKQFISTVASGTKPYACSSTTMNTNLNADMVDGIHVGTVDSALCDISQTCTWTADQVFSNIEISHKNPILQLTDTSPGEDDWQINVDAGSIEIINKDTLDEMIAFDSTKRQTRFTAPTGINVTDSITIGNLLILESITLPTCSSTRKGNIGRNTTGIYYCNSTAWKQFQFVN